MKWYSEVLSILGVCIVILLLLGSCVAGVRDTEGRKCYQMRKAYPSMNFRVRLFCEVETEDGWFTADSILGHVDD